MNKIFVDRIYYSEKENVDEKESSKTNYIIREIQTVSDYLRAIESILSNYYIAGDPSPIKYFENLFGLKKNKLKEIISEGLFFRGQSRYFEFIVPSIFRNICYIKKEEEIIKEAEILYSMEIQKSKNQMDKLALMQHYGLPTRILDITTNALVALYFAVSENNNEDGVIYLFNKRMAKNKDILTSKSTPILIKAALSKLTFKEKILLDLAFSKINNKDISITSLKKVNHRILCIIEKIYDNIKIDIGFVPTNIRVSDFYGLDFVSPLEIDERIIRQNALFMVFGLDGIYNASKKALEDTKNNKKIKEKRVELIKLKEYFHKKNEVLERKIDELMDEDEKNIKEKELKALIRNYIEKVTTLEREINEIKTKKQNKKFEEEIKKSLDELIINHMLLYSPEYFLPKKENKWIFYDNTGKKIHDGNVIILLKAEYKQRIKNELELIGISKKSIYPDMQNKSQYIKEKYL